MNTPEEARQRFKNLAEEYKKYRNTAYLISWLRSRIQNRLFETTEEEDPETGILIALLNSLYRLEQFEGLINEENSETIALVDLINCAKWLEKTENIVEEPTNK